jgi:hypothetical protein
MEPRHIIVFLVIIFINGGLKSKDNRDIYELPNGYRGIVTIYHSEDCGQKLKKKKGQRIIQIPIDGILIIKDEDLNVPFNIIDRGQERRHNPNVYCEVNEKVKTELPELDKQKFEKGVWYDFTEDQIGVFHLGLGSGETYLRDTVTYAYYHLFIGSYKELTSDKFHIDSYLKDKESRDKLFKCRGI